VIFLYKISDANTLLVTCISGRPHQVDTRQ
jgi:hypothetical protein